MLFCFSARSKNVILFQCPRRKCDFVSLIAEKILFCFSARGGTVI